MSKSTSCIDGHSLLALKARILSNEEAAALADHLRQCPACEAKVVDLLSDSPEITELKTQLQPYREALNGELRAERIIATDYELLEDIGEGRYGRVVRARHIPSQGIVALKLLTGSAVREELREAKRAMEIRSDHIVQVIGVVENHNPPFVIMECVNGPTLREWMRERTLSVEEITLIGGQLAQALADAHDHGMLHRDIKPANILLENRHGDVRVKLTDFGIAAAFSDAPDGTVIRGTPSYIAPEVASGQTPGKPGSDLFSLGCVLYEMCTGQRAFPASSLEECRKRLRRPPAGVRTKNPKIPEWLERLVHSLLELDPQTRLHNARELVRALGHGQNGAPLLIGVSVEEVKVERYAKPWHYMLDPFRSVEPQSLHVHVEPPPHVKVSWKVMQQNERMNDDGQGRYAFKAGQKCELEFHANDSRAQFLPAARIPIPMIEKILPAPLWLKMLTLLIAVLVVYFTYLNMRPSKGDIASCLPQANHMYQLTGTARIDSDKYLYLIVETSDGNWPKGPAVVVQSDGSWQHRIHHQPQYGSQASFALWEVTAEGHERIQMWLNNAHDSGNRHFDKMSQIDGRRLDTIVVTSQRPEGRIVQVLQQGDTLRIEGTAVDIPPDHQLLLAVRSQEMHWPKEATIQIDSQGKWTAEIKHQPEQSVSAELTLWVIDPQGRRVIDDWLQEGRESTTYEPLNTIEHGTLLDVHRL